MNRTIVNPWTWQEKLGFVHGNKVENAQSMLFAAGQTASDENGHCQCPDDMPGQIDIVIENMGKILEQSGMNFTHVVRLNIFTIDMDKLLEAHDHMVNRLGKLGCRHAGTLLGVSALASPGALVEMEITAAQ